MPPYLAGRVEEQREFVALLTDPPILQNLILTGLRGVGKTVLLETLKPHALRRGWAWIGGDLSESASVSEETLAIRVITDLSVVTAGIAHPAISDAGFGFGVKPNVLHQSLDYDSLVHVYTHTPGLPIDKLKAVFDIAIAHILRAGKSGIVVAYDEAQCMADRADADQYPMSVLLELFQRLQRAGSPILLVLTGLPTLYPKLVAARTFTERMFHVMTLDRLTSDETREAVTRPIQASKCPVQFTEDGVDRIARASGGYPYFIQFFCREVYDVLIQRAESDLPLSVPLEDIERKLDADFFSGRWSRATDRQRELLSIIARLESAEFEFTVQEIVQQSNQLLDKPFSASHVNQMLTTLAEHGLVYKNRHGKYSFAVPLLNRFILRQLKLR
jgi:hypothetical protein